jgi:hypothetical protein
MEVEITRKSTAELVALYNEIATKRGTATVNKFSDKKTAIKRVLAILADTSEASKPAEASTPTAPKPANVPKGEPVAKNSTLELFDCRAENNRARLILSMHSHLGSSQSVAVLVEDVYGKGSSADSSFNGKLMMVMGGMKATIVSKKLKFEVKKTKQGNETHFGLYEVA